MIIAIDFDGTICRDSYPEIGELYPAARDVINQLRADGHYIIIWTCRTGDMLENAVNWLLENGVGFDRVNAQHPDNIARYGNDPRKIYADIYIDDRQVVGLPTWGEMHRQITDLNESAIK